ncbi:protein MpMAPKKK6 [Marchantia polymorpha subsp. ruderalis]|uniref:Protein kinase domain-containing protein n=1 Tax=Marchantia polymorpha TaxID=3197 RepID=A0A2R6WG47_MARPO|nr:hypothetical protein MARPO_0094s0009 [Marchantia polymorpha]BBN02705.1 hypothetical protein Mp_2g17410 [Marchantia polymorpha subsp. ruderalis]|eukprot:PTQ32828.1 hypothetical protein MARPO_0094s0009 [Marchantia polymorpha]
MNEITIYLVLETPRVVQYLGSSFSHENGKRMLNLFLEYLPGGSLRKHINRLGGRLREPLIKTYTRAIVEALHHLHGKGIVHGDVKADNVLVGINGVKLCDFGGSRFVDQDHRRAMKGTAAWMAPEVVAELDQGFPSDIWSLGCTVIEMATGQDPWGYVRSRKELRVLQLSRKTPDVSSLSFEVQRFVKKCLVRNPKDRLTAAQLLEDEFLSKKLEDSSTSSASPALARIRATFPDTPEMKAASEQKLREPSVTISPATSKPRPSRPGPFSFSIAPLNKSTKSRRAQAVKYLDSEPLVSRAPLLPETPLDRDRVSDELELEFQRNQIHENAHDLDSPLEPHDIPSNEPSEPPRSASQFPTLVKSELYESQSVFSDHSPSLRGLERPHLRAREVGGQMDSTIPFGTQRDSGLSQAQPNLSYGEFLALRIPRSPPDPTPPPRVFFRDHSDPSSRVTSQINVRDIHSIDFSRLPSEKDFDSRERSADRFTGCRIHRGLSGPTHLDIDSLVYMRPAPSPATDVLSDSSVDFPVTLCEDSLDSITESSHPKVNTSTSESALQFMNWKARDNSIPHFRENINNLITLTCAGDIH